MQSLQDSTTFLAKRENYSVSIRKEKYQQVLALKREKASKQKNVTSDNESTTPTEASTTPESAPESIEPLAEEIVRAKGLYKEDGSLQQKIESLSAIHSKMEPLSHKKDASQLEELLLKESPNSFIQ